MVIKREIAIPCLSGDKKRRLYVYLPEDYHENAEKRYPVMYMFDGHNVFFDEDATFGKSWGMNEYLLETRKQLIVVAVECNSEGYKRLEEYSPVDFTYAPVGCIAGKGDKYLDWMIGELKMSVDCEFRTLSGRQDTSVCGSSMGGLMALYAVMKYNSVFQKAACLSPSLWIAPDRIHELMRAFDVLKDTVVYMDYGSKEMKNHRESKDALLGMTELLTEKEANVTFRIVPGGKHSEESWERQIPVFMKCLNL